MRRQRIKYQIVLTIILVLSVFLSAGLSSAGTSEPPPPVNALVGDTLNTNIGYIDLTARPALFLDGSGDAETLATYSQVSPQKQPYLIALDLQKVAAELAAAGIHATLYTCQGTPPVDTVVLPALVSMSGGEMITTPFWQLNAVLQGMRSPILIGDASLPNIPSQDPSENNAVCAAAAINGDIVQPGQEFSFYKSIGVPSADRGYQMSRSLAGTITTNTPAPTDTTTTPAGTPPVGTTTTTPANTPVGTTTTTPVWADDIAGGICKTATVLNLAVENAGLDVTERHHHSMPVPYVPVGQDTAVARSAGWDYCFVNNGSVPIKIESVVSGDTLRFQIWETWQS